MELLLLLMTAHFIGDFYLQPSRSNEPNSENEIKSKPLWRQVLPHSILNIMVFLLFGTPWLQSITWIVIISLSHFASYYWHRQKTNNLHSFLTVQAFHIFIITLAWLQLSNFSLTQVLAFLDGHVTAKNLIIAIAYLLVCKPASIIISLALKKHTDNLMNDAEVNNTANAKIVTPDVTVINQNEVAVEGIVINKDALINKEIGLISAGAWIGYIERCLAISFIFIGQFAGIGFLVATKTIFRFGDLTKNKDMKLTEYMMLGTLLSYAIALFIGWSALKIYLTM